MFGPFRSQWGPVYMDGPMSPQITQPQPSQSSFGWLLLTLLSIIYLAGAVSGLAQLTGLPFFIAGIIAGVMFLMKMYFLRRQLWYEQFTSNGWDRVVGYLATALVFTMLTAYGLYGVNLRINGPPALFLTPEGDYGNSLLPEKPPQQHGDRQASCLLTKEETATKVVVGELPESDKPLPADNPATKYREDRPVWWNDLLGKQRPIQKFTDDGTLADKPPSSPLGSGEFRPPAEAVNDFVVVQPSGLLSVEDAHDIKPITLSKNSGAPRVTFEGFVNDTMSHSNHALGCWLLAAILEGFIVMLVNFNRPRYA